jgi:hypothetical protein
MAIATTTASNQPDQAARPRAWWRMLRLASLVPDSTPFLRQGAVWG